MKLETPTSGSELTAQAVAMLETRHKLVPPIFVPVLFGRVPAEDLAPYSSSALADLAAAAYEHLRSPRRQGADIRLLDLEVEREGRARDVTVLEVVNDNMPFLLDSTLAEIVDEGYEPLLVAHPILAVERDDAGALVRLVRRSPQTGQPAEAGVRRESFIHIHLPRIDDEAARRRLVEALTHVYADVARRGARLARHARRRSPRSSQATGSIRRRCPPTRSPRRSLSSTGCRATISPSSACASTACRRATPPPIRWKARASASCAIPRCACCGAAASSWR